MKISYRILLAFTTVLVLALGCQKEISLEDGQLPPIGTDDSTLLVKLMDIDSVSPIQQDTLILEFEYDNKNRLIAGNGYFTADPVAQSMSYSKGKYYYLNADTLPYKTTSTFSEDVSTGDIDYDTTFLFYNTLGKITKDSTVYFTNTVFLHNESRWYKYSGDSTIIDQYRNGAFSRSDTQVLTIVNGNITRAKFEGSTYQISYDNKPNPFTSLASFNTQQALFWDGDLLYFPTRNNFTTIISDPGSIDQQNATTTYTYRRNGLPATRRIISQETIPVPRTQTVKSFFTYTKKR